jgi:beta-galactosidase
MEPKFPFILHGGDYNPEQFPEHVWDEDVRLMNKAGINIATLPVFGWGHLNPAEDVYNFDDLDKVIEKLHAGGISFCMATATAATPPWVDQKYPDILRTDRSGFKRRHSERHTFCPHSKNFQRLSTNLTRKMAERYGNHPGLLVWHISNEMGNHCYCQTCTTAFQEWLKVRYGTLQEVNHRWNMAFWGQVFTAWDQIEAPVDNAQRNFQGLLIDYDRFQSESILNCYRLEKEILREATPNIPITTNFMGTFKPLDYHAWAKELDIISWDSYPRRNAHPSEMAFQHSVMRGLKEGQPWMLMEQTPSQQNWSSPSSLKRPGIMRLWSFQAVAHGADAVMYFQWRRSPGAQEMFHGAVVEHAAREDARVFKEVSALGAELASLGTQTLNGRVQSDIAILFDWDNWWAVEYSSGPHADLRYVPQVHRVFMALWNLGFSADVVSPESDLSSYKVVIAPLMKMVKPGVADRLKAFAKSGGTVISTYFSGIVDETDRAFPNGYPGPLSDLFGIWVEEIDSQAPGEENSAKFTDGSVYECGFLCDQIVLEGAEAIASYEADFYAGKPVITSNQFGAGRGVYIGAQLEASGLEYILEKVALDAKVSYPLGARGPENVEIQSRSNGTSNVWYVLNHGSKATTVPLPAGDFVDLLSGQVISGNAQVDPLGVLILTKK